MRRIAVLALLCIACFGCSDDPYTLSSKAGADIASGITQAMNTVAQLQQQHTITNQEALNALGYFEFANRGDEAFLACASTAHAGGNKPGTYTACAQTFNAALNNPDDLALIHVSNSTALTTISNAVKALAAGVAQIQSSLGGK